MQSARKYVFYFFGGDDERGGESPNVGYNKPVKESKLRSVSRFEQTPMFSGALAWPNVKQELSRPRCPFSYSCLFPLLGITYPSPTELYWIEM